MLQKIICKNYEELSQIAAFVMAGQIHEKPNSVLGLATGGTPVGMYANLSRMHQRGDLDFSHVTTYNLDEYYPIQKTNRQSYDFFMWDNLFSHVNIDRSNIHLPNGEAPDPELECRAYDAAIQNAGGIDMQLLGIGVNGHIGFNEPADELVLPTHVTGLTESTIEANARFFATRDEVPKQALTMGIGPIMAAKRILLIISGENKAPVVARLFSGRVTTQVPASLLMMHPHVVVVLDQAAAASL